MTKAPVAQYSLHNIANFNSELTVRLEDVQIKYNNLLSEYLYFILDNIVIKDESFFKFIIQRGIFVVTSVFNLILLYSKNLDVAYFHSQKAFYFYVEFIGQISEDQHTFLQLSSRDAMMFVYKKTIFNIDIDMKQKYQEKNENYKFLSLEKNQYIYQNLVGIFLENCDMKIIVSQMKNHINKIEKIIKKVARYNFLSENLDIILLFIEQIKQNKQTFKGLEIDSLCTTIDVFVKRYYSFINKEIKNKNKEIKSKILLLNLEDTSDLDAQISDLFL